jgi:hypothetical protein
LQTAQVARSSYNRKIESSLYIKIARASISSNEWQSKQTSSMGNAMKAKVPSPWEAAERENWG